MTDPIFAARAHLAELNTDGHWYCIACGQRAIQVLPDDIWFIDITGRLTYVAEHPETVLCERRPLPRG